MINSEVEEGHNRITDLLQTVLFRQVPSVQLYKEN